MKALVVFYLFHFRPGKKKTWLDATIQGETYMFGESLVHGDQSVRGACVQSKEFQSGFLEQREKHQQSNTNSVHVITLSRCFVPVKVGKPSSG